MQRMCASVLAIILFTLYIAAALKLTLTGGVAVVPSGINSSVPNSSPPAIIISTRRTVDNFLIIRETGRSALHHNQITKIAIFIHMSFIVCASGDTTVGVFTRDRHYGSDGSCVSGYSGL